MMRLTCPLFSGDTIEGISLDSRYPVHFLGLRSLIPSHFFMFLPSFMKLNVELSL